MSIEGIIQYGKLRPNKSNPAHFILTISKCLFCGKKHTHGWREGSGNKPQPRVPHCSKGPMGPNSEAWNNYATYLIAPVKDAV